MKDTFGGATVHRFLHPDKEHADFPFRKVSGIKSSPAADIINLNVTSLKPSDPFRQAKRLPVKILTMLTAHSGHLLHPEYLQPLTSAPVSIELDAKKSPLALLAQTCSQIGKPDPPSSSKLASVTSSGLSDKDSSRSSSSTLKLGEQRPSLDDKSSFKPYSKIGTDSQRDGTNSSSSTNKPSASPSTGRSSGHSQTVNGEFSNLKKEAESSKASLDSPQLANSSHARASANSSSGSSDSSPSHEGKAETQPSQPGGLGPVSISPFKSSHPVFPLPSSSMGYHGSIVGTYAGYPGQFVPGLDPTKSSLGGAGVGVAGKHPSSSPLTGASPPSFMQGLCRDPYCLSYPNAPHLGGSNCSTCVHDPSTLKSGFPLVYPTHPLHSLHQSSSVTPSLSHPLYTYGFMLANEPLPHACNWVSAGGPCDKRFATSEELLAHLRTHTSLPGVDGKLLSAYPSSSSSAAAATASCHLHLPPQSSPASLPTSFSLRAPPSLGLARYHPYSKMHLPTAPSLPMHSLPASAPYYSHYALYSQRLGSASALGYQ
uniref:Zinc finger protein 703 n=1 Tax=Astyanax mexicanus TaxID=7994 RepID=A0A3B1K603_ASTMX